MSLATTLHQIEITSRCQLACPYCLHPTMTRPKIDMALDVYAAALRWVRYFLMRGTQGELVLIGTGEPFLHPDLVAMVAAAREALGPARRILITTNGLAVTPDLIAALAPYAPRVYVSLHRPEKATAAVHALGHAGLLEGVSIDPVLYANSWAGQVDWPDVTRQDHEAHGTPLPVCPWTQQGWLFVDAEGQIRPCCYADSDAPVTAHVREAPRVLPVDAWAKCAACWQRQGTVADAPVELLR